MEYKVVQIESQASFGGALKRLEAEVNNLLQKGWSLHGELKITSHSSGYFVVAQAMIKNKK